MHLPSTTTTNVVLQWGEAELLANNFRKMLTWCVVVPGLGGTRKAGPSCLSKNIVDFN